jgi:tetratricopeptide (TPR) repeat protein
MRAASGLGERDKVIASALARLAEKRYPEACAAYSQLISSDSLDFVGLYGLGQCKSLDSLVLPSARSPSGYEFRSRYFDAAGYFMAALRVNSGANSFFSFDKLQEMLPIASTRTRRGKSSDGGEFAAYPTLLKDSVVFVPYPLRKFAQLPAVATAAGHSAALARNLDVLFDFTTEWTKASPRNPSAYRALADVLDARGEIGRSRTGGMSALAASQRARELATSRRDTLLGATREAWLRFKQGEFSRSRQLTDSILIGLVNPSREEADAVVGLAALTGKIARMSELARSPYTYAAAVSNVPVAVADAAAPFFTAAALGLCGDATDKLEQSLDQQLARYVADDQQPAITTAVKARPLSMLAPCSGAKSSLRIQAGSNRLLRLQQTLANGDTAGVKEMLKALAADNRSQRPGDIALDFTYQIAWLSAAVGDTAGAIRLLDRSLGSMPSMSAPSLREAASAAAVARAMMLRAEIAAARSENDEKTKWASAVTELWATADPPLHPYVKRMRALANSKIPR